MSKLHRQHETKAAQKPERLPSLFSPVPVATHSNEAPSVFRQLDHSEAFEDAEGLSSFFHGVKSAAKSATKGAKSAAKSAHKGAKGLFASRALRKKAEKIVNELKKADANIDKIMDSVKDQEELKEKVLEVIRKSKGRSKTKQEWSDAFEAFEQHS